MYERLMQRRWAGYARATPKADGISVKDGIGVASKRIEEETRRHEGVGKPEVWLSWCCCALGKFVGWFFEGCARILTNQKKRLCEPCAKQATVGSVSS